MIAMCWRGHADTPERSVAMACLGEAGNDGHHQVTSGCWFCTISAIFRAFIDWGDERKPCR